MKPKRKWWKRGNYRYASRLPIWFWQKLGVIQTCAE